MKNNFVEIIQPIKNLRKKSRSTCLNEFIKLDLYEIFIQHKKAKDKDHDHLSYD